MALCISLLFLGGKQIQAEMLNIAELTDHWIWPTDGVITDTYGTRAGKHYGIDIAGGYRSPIHSVDAGIVTKSYYSNTYGHVVFVKHPNNLETVYAHLRKRNVQEGQRINQGEIIGEMGNTGRSSGVHLHFEIHKFAWTINKQNAINPIVALGNIELGDYTYALKIANKRDETLTVAKNIYEDSRFFLENDRKLIEEQFVISQGEELVEEVKETEEIAENVSEEDASEQTVVHIVENGDTLWDLAEKYHSTVERIQQINELETTTIVPDQSLQIEMIQPSEYIVQMGDTLTSIAAKTNITIEELIQQNHLKADIIHPQQILTIEKVGGE